MPAASASAAVWLAPVEPSRMNATQMSAPSSTIAALRRNPAALPCARQSAGWHSTRPPHRVQHWLTPAQADGLACVVCGVDYRERNTPRRPVGWSQSGSQVFACCEHRAVRHAVAGGYVDVRPGPTGREVAAARRARADAAPELDTADFNYGEDNHGQDDLGAVTDLDGVTR